jgi:hypothetical protein
MPSDPTLADLRQVLIDQFLLHEVQHHAQVPLVPVAHGLVDIYKCLHQGEFGVGHTIDHMKGFKQRLFEETRRDAASGPAGEPLVETISPDGKMLRINLRALTHACKDDVPGALDALALVCVESASVTRGSSTRFHESLDRFKRINQAGEIVLAGYTFAFPSEMVETFLFEVRQLMGRIREVPVFSHSDPYKRFNRPSYRVVLRPVLETSPLAVLLEK